MFNIDIFCDVIDNYGDIGVVYRLAKNIHQINKNILINIYINKYTEVKKLVENFDSNLIINNFENLNIINIERVSQNSFKYNASKVIIEAFGTEIPDFFKKSISENAKLIINLEYLSGETWIEGFHKKKSISYYEGIEKYFFMPGFTEKSGGIILDYDYLSMIKSINSSKEKYFNNFFKEKNINCIYNKSNLYISIFTYEFNFKSMIKSLSKVNKNIYIFLCGEKTQKSFDFILKEIKIYKNIHILYMPFFIQKDYDYLINLMDFNFVRGEESLARATISGIPFLWHIYKQEEYIHLDKLNSFLDRMSENIDINADIFKKYKDISISTNNILKDEIENNFEINFDDLFNIILDNSSFFKKFSEYLIKKCDLTKQLIEFINEKI
ncbi:elongation factor P maturation arginine rhamnosyltransferase EarP [Haliovirga abyssi]|uniref:Protein-arginine rhamnosyltransferase n=1 Tax=Haliovirga abyssi TaxID=2996794 RepID=A0AAU9E208_9FUSO|nr:elongation factor P maturation arginine rhamnosyltransferase EarP [Haliovirga abyssi]BDU50430.1 hypothetical protein HLVA_09990 [Haliovirga abyssi]